MRTNDRGWAETFRTIVTYEYSSGETGTTIYGPFATKVAAKSAGTRALKGYCRVPQPGYSFTVERAATVWEAIE